MPSWYGEPLPEDYGDDECIGCIRGDHEHCQLCGKASTSLVPSTDVDCVPQTVMACATCREGK